MVITIIHCEFRVPGAGVVVYRMTLHVFVQKVCLLSLSRKTLQSSICQKAYRMPLSKRKVVAICLLGRETTSNNRSICVERFTQRCPRTITLMRSLSNK